MNQKVPLYFHQTNMDWTIFSKIQALVLSSLKSEHIDENIENERKSEVATSTNDDTHTVFFFGLAFVSEGFSNVDVFQAEDIFSTPDSKYPFGNYTVSIDLVNSKQFFGQFISTVLIDSFDSKYPFGNYLSSMVSFNLLDSKYTCGTLFVFKVFIDSYYVIVEHKYIVPVTFKYQSFKYIDTNSVPTVSYVFHLIYRPNNLNQILTPPIFFVHCIFIQRNTASQ